MPALIPLILIFLLVCVSLTIIGSHETASLSAECSRDKPPFSFVRGQDLTMWDIVWVSPQGHRSVSVSRHFLLQTPQCPCSVRKQFSRDHCCRGRSKPGCRIVGSHTRWELTTEPTSSYASIDLWCPLVANLATTAFWISVVAIAAAPHFNQSINQSERIKVTKVTNVTARPLPW